MDFRLPQVNGLRFCYLLPTSRRSALVEVAVFGGSYREGGDDDDLAQTLGGYLRDTCGLPGWQLRRRECGDLPPAAAGGAPGRSTGPRDRTARGSGQGVHRVRLHPSRP
jgi:hypothetical protein